MTRCNSVGSIRRKLLRTTPLAGGLLAGMCLMATPARAQNLPDTANVDFRGTTAAGFTTTGTNLTVDLNADRTIIEWGGTGFDIAAGYSVYFNDSTTGQPGNIAVLNRDVSGNATLIDGTLASDSNVSVYLINGNGILFGSGAYVNVGGLIASSLDIEDSDFLDGSSYTFTTSGNGVGYDQVTVASGAQILTDNGPLVLLGGFVSNEGTLDATGDVVMAAAGDVTVDMATGSPISMTINEGTPISGGVIAGGTIQGKNVYLAVASKSGITDALLNVTGTVIANTATTTDRGIVLAAGASANGITVASGDTTGVTGITLDDLLDSTTNVQIRSSGNVDGVGSIEAAQDVDIGVLGSVALTGSVEARDIALTADSDISTGSLSARDDIVVRGGGAVTAGALTSGATLADGGPVDVSGIADTLLGGTLSNHDIDIVAAGTVTLTNNVTTNGSGGNVRLHSSGAGIDQTGGVITTATLSGSAATFANLASQNEITTLAGFTTGTGFTLNDEDGLVISNAVAGGTGGVSISTSDTEGTAADLTVDAAVSGGGAVNLTAEQALSVGDGRSVSGGTGVTLTGATIALDDNTITSSGGDVTFTGNGGQTAVTLAGASTVNATGAAGEVMFDGTVDGPGGLTANSNSGTTFGGLVGDSNALSALTVTGATRLDAASIDVDGGISLQGLTVTGPAAINAGGALLVTGDITTTVAGSALSLSGSSISVTNVGTTGTRFGDIHFLNETTLGGNVWSNGDVQFDALLTLTGNGAIREVTADTASFQDIRSQVNRQTGLAVTTTGNATFNGDIGTKQGNVEFRLSAFGLSADELTVNVLDGKVVRADLLAIHVATGNIELPFEGDLKIGKVGSVEGLVAETGFINVSLTGAGSNLTIDGEVRAAGSVTLSALGNIDGSAVVTSGDGNTTTAADVTLNAGGTLSVGNVTSGDDVSITSGGRTTTGTLTAGANRDLMTVAHTADTQYSDVTINANGIEAGAIAVTNNIMLNGGSGGVGSADRDLSLSAPGDITISGTGLGIDIALSAGGNVSTGDLTARDDVVVSAGDSISTGNVSSGVIVDDEDPIDTDFTGAADQLASVLAGVTRTLSGYDIEMNGQGIATGTIVANGLQSDVVLDGGLPGIGSSLVDLNVFAGGDISLLTDARGDFVTLQAGGSIEGYDVAAVDDITVSAGTVDLDTVSSDFGSGSFFAASELNLVAADFLGSGTFSSSLGNITIGSADLGGDGNFYTEEGNLSLGFTRIGGNATLEAGSFTGTNFANLNNPLVGTSVGGDIVIGQWRAGDLEVSDVTANGNLRITSRLGNLTVADVASLNGNVTLRVNSSSPAHDLYLTGDVTTGTAEGRTVSLTAVGGSILQTAGTSITTNTLTGSAGEDASLLGDNRIINLGKFEADGFGINLLVAVGETAIDITDEIDGGAYLTITVADGGLNIGNNLTTTGTLTLGAWGNINQTAGVITAASLTGNSGGSTSLTSNNKIDALLDFSANGFILNDLDGLVIEGAVNDVLADITDGNGAVAITTSGDLTLNLGATVGAINHDVALTTTHNEAIDSNVSIAGAVSSGTGDIAITADDALSLAESSSIASSGGSIALTGTGITQLSGGTVNAGAGTISLNANDGNISLAGSLSTTNATNTAVQILNAANVTLGNISAANGALVLGVGGDDRITGNVTQGAGSAVVAGKLTGDVDGLVTLMNGGNQFATLADFAAGQGLKVADSNLGLIVGDSELGGDVDGGSGAVEILTVGLLTLSGNAHIDGVGISLTGTGVTQDADSTIDGMAGAVLVDGNNGAILLAGSLTSTSDGDDAVRIVDASSASLGAITATNGTVTIGGAGADAITGNAIQTNAMIAGALTGNVDGSATFDHGANDVGTLLDFSANGFILNDLNGLMIDGAVNDVLGDDLDGKGVVAITTSGLLTLDSTSRVGTVDDGSQAYAIALTAVGITQVAGGLVNSGGGTISLDANDGDIDLAGLLTTTNGTNAAVQILNAANVMLGDISAANGTLVLGGLGDDAITGNVGQNEGTAILASSLTGTVDGEVVLEEQDNEFANLLDFTADALSLYDVSGADGLDIGGDVVIGGELRLVSEGDIEQVTGILDVGTLSGSSVGGAQFALTDNQIRALGVEGAEVAFTNANGGGFHLNTTTGLTVYGDVDAGSGDMSIDAQKIDFGANLLTAGTDITLTAIDSIVGPTGTVDAGVDLTAIAGSINIGTAIADAGALGLTATGGQLTLGTGIAGTTVTLIKEGATGNLLVSESATGQGDVTVKTTTDAAIKKLQSNAGNILVEALSGSLTGVDTEGDGAELKAGPGSSTVVVKAENWARLDAVSADAVTVEAAQLHLSGTMEGRATVDLINTGLAATRLGTGAEGGGFALTEAEVDHIVTPTLNIRSGSNDIAISALEFSDAAGSSRINLLTTGRVDVTGEVKTGQAGNARVVQIGGGDVDSGEASHIWVEATADAGGRLLMGNSILHLRGTRIAVGQTDMLAELGGLTEQGVIDEIGDAGSKIYRPTVNYTFANGLPAVLVSASAMTVTYGSFAVFQNTALPNSIPGGVAIGSETAPGTLTLNSTGTDGVNGFSMSGEINGRRGVETAVLGPTFIVTNGVNFNNSRINGCLVGSGGNCIINIVATPMYNPFDEAMADVLSTGGDLTLTLDPVVGANNEALFSGISSVDEATEEEQCADGDNASETCPAKEDVQ